MPARMNPMLKKLKLPKTTPRRLSKFSRSARIDQLSRQDQEQHSQGGHDENDHHLGEQHEQRTDGCGAEPTQNSIFTVGCHGHGDGH